MNEETIGTCWMKLMFVYFSIVVFRAFQVGRAARQSSPIARLTS